MTALTVVRARPRHLLVGGLVAGLLAGPRLPAALILIVVAAPLLTADARIAVLLVAVALGGAALAHARDRALDRSGLTTRLGHVVTLDVTLTESPRETAWGWRAAAQLGGDRVMLQGKRARPPWSIGDIVRTRGALEALGPRDAWMRVRRVDAILRLDRAAWTGRRRGGPAGAIDAIRRRAEAALGRGLPRREGALMRGMVLGDDSALTRADRDDLRASGLGHLVAASGQNVALLVLLAAGAGAMLGLGWTTRLLAALALIALYVPLAGSGPSIQRAGIMGAATVVAALSSRPADRWYALLAAAALTLAIEPRAAEDPGWQLSFAAVIAIATLGPVLAARLRRRGAPEALAQVVAVTAAATLGTAPVAAAAFGTVSLVSLPANVAAAPLVAPITWLGMVAAGLGQIAPGLATPLVAAASWPLGLVTWIGHAGAGVPHAQVRASWPIVAGVVSTVVATGLSRGVRRRLPAALPVLCALALFIARPPAALAPPAQGTTRVTFLDVGQGDATLVQAGGRALLMDSGPPDGPIVSRLRRAGVRRLDVLAATHAQADHDGGAARVLRAVPVGLVLDGRDGVRDHSGTAMAATAAARNVRLAAPVAGDRLRLGAIDVRILWPPPRAGAAAAGGDPNDRAIVALVRAPGVRLLLTADAESNVLSRLDIGPVDVLKVSHHGSADPGLPMLLQRLRPRLAVIEVGAHNTYGHPVPQTVAALRSVGAQVLRTDRDGTVRLDARAGAAPHVHTHS